MSILYDCIVVGSGHAGSSAALSAVQHGCQKVLVIDKCPREWAGGNGCFTAAAYRTVHDGLQDLLPIVSNISPEKAETIDMLPYTKSDFTQDVMRLSDNRSDPEIVKAVVDESREAIQWLKDYVGVPFILSFHRQAYEINGRQKFWGGMVLSADDGGKGLIAAHHRALERHGIEVWYDCQAIELLEQDGAVAGVIARQDGGLIELRSRSVILATGGFEASQDLRRKYLGEVWESARVRGTPYNTGDGLTLAQKVGALIKPPLSAFSEAGCHSTCWDYNAPLSHGDRILSNQYTKSGYPLGVMVNSAGKRFVDEGEDFRNYTYAKFGKRILEQEGGMAIQVYDSKVISWLRKEEYGDDVVEKIWGDTLEELADKLTEKGLKDKTQFLHTVHTFNESIRVHQAEHPNLKWNPSVKDGLSTDASMILPKSNWALPINVPPFLAVRVACGITFTFGGLAIEPETAGVVKDAPGKKVVKGLFCTGELVGGLFYGNYPGGSGLTAGAVFGRKAGREAAKLAGY
ncbi:FAD/NAD(P)-binding domain-containing protein [Neolentinus lepideus HHB14362 ss-1]|uniref:FAD/NAD(P)-binding domain-containing protein n=1 Tax=Neolentinus lepideus HHB14362 ss-1 TaxID=1314782 RepID=A0A165TYV0_9AGAM|nr:FAD/NAD(P)-binding domain-containing protein [Neolentinus lepideus HHB14362 ss-1]